MRISLTRRERIIVRLTKGPASGAQLAELLYTHTGDIARIMCALRKEGLVASTATGRGTKATYSLVVK